MNWVLMLPILIPIVTAILVFFSWHKPNLQRFITTLGCLALILSAVILLLAVLKKSYLVSQMGSWPAPFGITVIADMLSSLMIVATSLVSLCVVIFSYVDINIRCVRRGFYPAYCILLAGVCGALLTGDLFNLYVWFEIILIASFVLLSLSEEKLHLEGIVKYSVLNLIATLFLLTAIAFLYGITGTLNLADLAICLQHTDNTNLVSTIAVIFIVSFAIKAALFPVFFWLPAAYHTTSYSASALFSGLLSKVGVYALLRIFTLLFIKNSHYLQEILLILINFTLLIGIICAIAQIELRRIFSFALISHIGYMLVGLAILTPLALAGSIFYMIQHMLCITSLFLLSGYIAYQTGSTDITKSRNLYGKFPYLSIFFFICAFSLAGMPPLSGFWAKIMLISAAFISHSYLTTLLLVLTSLLTIFVMARIWQNMFLHTAETPYRCIAPVLTFNQKLSLFLPIIFLTTLIIFIGFMPNILYTLSNIAAQQILNPQGYIHAVMGS